MLARRNRGAGPTDELAQRVRGVRLPCLLGVLHFARTGQAWTFLSFPTYGGGPYERVGLHTSVPLLIGFLAVCVAEIVIGLMLWRRDSVAPVLGYALLPLELAFWIGFALPVGPILGLPAPGSC